MPVSIAAMRSVAIPLTAETVFGPVNFAYEPAALSDEWVQRAVALEKADDTNMDDTIALIQPVIASWDVEGPGADGAMVTLPVNADTLRAVGPLVRQALSQAVMEHAFPNRQRATAVSSNGSSRTASTAR